MAKNDGGLVQLSDIAQAMALLTRLPVPVTRHTRGGAAAWAYPIVGLIVGAIGALTGWLGHWAGLPAAAAALLSLGAMILTTGALHEDGLTDTADGLWGGWTREARLEIMKDSHIGTYGVLALILVTAARWIALWQLFEIGAGTACAALIAASTLSRTTLPGLMAALPPARATGLSHDVGEVSKATAAIASAIALAIALILAGGGAIWAALWAALTGILIARIAVRKIGGQTGDILGATQQLSEVVILFSLLV